MIRLTDGHGSRLQRLALSRMAPALSQELNAAADSIVETAQRSLNDGAISGSGHIPGPPGGYSNSDTHDLEKSFHRSGSVEVGSEIRTSVVADSDHALYQELGTSKMAPRPNMQLATNEVRPTVIEALAARFVQEVNE